MYKVCTSSSVESFVSIWQKYPKLGTSQPECSGGIYTSMSQNLFDFFFYLLPLKKAQSSVGAPVVSQATRPLLNPTFPWMPIPASDQPSQDRSQPPPICHPTDVPPPTDMPPPCTVHCDSGSLLGPVGARSLVWVFFFPLRKKGAQG